MPERQKGEILFVVFFILFITPCFLWPVLELFFFFFFFFLPVPGREREYSQFPSKKKIHLQLLM